MRGEHQKRALLSRHAPGSSPHARGARLRVDGCASLLGIIPACAGSTSNVRFPTYAPRDHPRMRGEHYTREPSKLGCRGSSPHARGAPLLHRQCGVRRGIIPACAGSTKLLRFSYTQRGDHPRMRGEHAERMHWMEAHQGSSPHARGAHAPRQAPAPRQGIIPACAGSTSRAVATVQDGENHPRMRGEHA